jgi:AcrR family transcriptional regulator
LVDQSFQYIVEQPVHKSAVGGPVGRTRTFDEQQVVRAARGIFWDKGYADTAVPDLEAATGLRRSSIYHAFGSKRGLFDAAVESYLDEVVRPRLAPLLVDDVSPAALEDYLDGLRDAVLDGPSDMGGNGCLLMNATCSPLGHDEALRAVASRYHADLRTAVGAGVAARRPELDEDDTRALTTMVAALVLSAMTLVRVEPRAAAEVLDAARRAVRGAGRERGRG